MSAVNSGKLLVVDDDLVFRAMLEASLDDYQVQAVSSAEEALKLLEDFRPDVILLDVELSEGTGYDLCRQIRKLPHSRFTKIAFVSSHKELEKRLEGYDSGADDFITKPINSLEVVAKVRVLMRLKAVEEVDQLKRSFLSLISHETMTPLTIIRGYCDVMIKDTGLSPDRAKEGLRAISNAVEGLRELVTKTKLASSLQEQQSLNLYPLPIRSIVSDACSAHAGLAQSRNVTLKHSLEAATVLAEPTLLSRAVSSVINNAVRFSSEGTEVTVVGTARDGNYYMEIADGGPGIPEDFMPRVFEPFAVKDLLHHGRGVGLSLFIAKRILELHLGSIKVENSQNSGCVVKIRVRLAN